MVKLRCGLRAVLLMAVIMGLPWFQVAWADLDDGLVAYYPFNGNANDESGNGHDGAVNGASLTEDWFGNANSAYSFGGNDWIEIPNHTSIDLIGDLTITAWISAQGGSSEGRGLIVAKGDGNDYKNAYQLRFQYATGDQALLLSVSDGGTTASYLRESQGSIPFGNFAYVVATIQGTTAHTYVNGNKVDSDSITSNRFSDHGSLRIGGRGDGSAFFKGIIDEVRIYNRALSEDEVKQLYKSQICDEPCSGKSDTGGKPCSEEPDGKSSAAISFSNLKPLYNVGEKVVIDLEENVAVNRFNRVDLWVVIEIPGGGLLFMTGLALAPFSLNPQPFRSSLDNTQTTHRVLEFEVLPGLGGDYNFYAVHVEEGKNLMTDSFLVLRSNVAKVKVVLSNK